MKSHGSSTSGTSSHVSTKAEVDKALQFSQGYLELGMFHEALAELDKLRPPANLEAHVMLQRLFTHVESKHWKDGVEIGRKICTEHGHLGEAFISTAYCLHELKKTSEARELLLSGPSVLERNPLFHYNLACYEAQLGNHQAAREKLQTAINMDKKFKKIAQEDPDLEEIIGSI